MGKSIINAAISGDNFGKLAGGDFFSTFKQQMFKKMGNTGFSILFIGCADLVPDHMSNNRRSVIGNNHNFHAIGERKLTYVYIQGFGIYWSGHKERGE